MNAAAEETVLETGSPMAGGIYAGITVHNNIPMQLVLMPEDFTGNWKAAGTWAQELEAELPTRIDLLVMWNNVKASIEPDWYWSCETHRSAAGYAWCQLFNDGTQDDYHKGTKLRARAVRRLPL